MFLEECVKYWPKLGPKCIDIIVILAHWEENDRYVVLRMYKMLWKSIDFVTQFLFRFIVYMYI